MRSSQSVQVIDSADIVDRLCGVLMRVQERAGNDFSGIGLIVCDQSQTLPVCSLRPISAAPSGTDLIQQLADIAAFGSEFHDGFHILGADWKLKKIAQYFSPPIVNVELIDRSKRFGGRYLAALFGSALPDVRVTGVASRGFGVAVFRHGREVYYESSE